MEKGSDDAMKAKVMLVCNKASSAFCRGCYCAYPHPDAVLCDEKPCTSTGKCYNRKCRVMCIQVSIPDEETP